MEGKKPLYIFLHIPKCAGTTMRHILLENFGNRVILSYEWSNYDFQNKKVLKSYIRSLSKLKREKIRFIIGHNVYYGIHELFPDRECRYVTFLRNPIERTISDYNFQRHMIKKGIDVEQHKTFIFRNNKPLRIKRWFEDNEVFHNLIFKFLYARLFLKNSIRILKNYGLKENEVQTSNLKEIKKILKKFYFIGITENLRDFLFVYSRFGIKRFLDNANISKKYTSQKEIDDAKGFFASKLIFDKKLYKYALKLNMKFKIKHVGIYFFDIDHKFNGLLCFVKSKWQTIKSKVKSKWHSINLTIKSKLYQLTLGQLFEFSAALKQRSKSYVKFVKFIKKFFPFLLFS